jgi:hypothetical protein
LIPGSGTNYSYWVNTRLSIDAITSGTVNNIKWYTDGTNNLGTGVTMKVGVTSASGSPTYGQATGVAGTSGTQLTSANYVTAGGSALAGAPSDAFGYTSGSPLSVTGSTTSTGDVGEFVVYQIEVGSTASSGATGSETLTWKYDDTSS